MTLILPKNEIEKKVEIFFSTRKEIFFSYCKVAALTSTHGRLDDDKLDSNLFFRITSIQTLKEERENVRRQNGNEKKRKKDKLKKDKEKEK
jgi:hypothetical protein